MLAPNGRELVTGSPSSRVKALGIDLPAPPTPLGAYVEASGVGNLLFLSGILPVVNRRLAIAGRLGKDLSIEEGREAARLSSLNVLAAAKQYLGTIDRLKKLVRLTVVIATTAEFAEHASVADGASNLFVQIFGEEAGHTRVVFGAYTLPANAPVIVEAIFEIQLINSSTLNKKPRKDYI